ncbi:hypothetical protein TNCV_4930571 [Trichonephila clavipes]|nr:hypothetical protein TNCV_4930571 [Trichonephila clavipes]
MSGYRELYKKKIKESSSQSLITDYMVRKGIATQNENEVCENPWPLPQISIAETVSSDEGDLEPLRKRDEAHFWLNGYVNKQNCRIWSEANPQVYIETPLHPEKLTVWCALWAGGILEKRCRPQRYSQW